LLQLNLGLDHGQRLYIEAAIMFEITTTLIRQTPVIVGGNDFVEFAGMTL